VFTNGKKSTSLEKSKMNVRNSNGTNKRSGSECESANVSLLSTDTKDVSLSTATSLIVYEDRGTTHNLPNNYLPPLPSQFV